MYEYPLTPAPNYECHVCVVQVLCVFMSVICVVRCCVCSAWRSGMSTIITGCSCSGDAMVCPLHHIHTDKCCTYPRPDGHITEVYWRDRIQCIGLIGYLQAGHRSDLTICTFESTHSDFLLKRFNVRETSAGIQPHHISSHHQVNNISYHNFR